LYQILGVWVEVTTLVVSGLMMALRKLHKNAASHDGAAISLELSDAGTGFRLEGRGVFDATECDRWCKLHVQQLVGRLSRIQAN
jgi:hypothetical protein